MRSLLSILIVFLSSALFAQSYTNDWISDKMDQTWVKFKVPEDGIYRLTLSDFSRAGVSSSDFNGANLQLFFDGQEVPIHVTTPGRFSSTDFVEFYGHKNTSGFEKEFYESLSDMPDTNTSLITDTAVYFITWNNRTNNLRITELANELNNLPAKEEYFWHKVFKKFTHTYNEGEPFDVSGQGTNLTNSSFGMSEAYTSVNIKGSSFPSQSFATKNIHMSGPDANFQATVVGWYNDAEVNPDHHAKVQIGNITMNQKFEGYDIHHFNESIPVDQLDADNNNSVTVKFSTLQDLTRNDFIRLSHMKLTYPREFDFTSLTEMDMILDGGNDPKYIEVENWNNQSSTPIILDYLNHERILGIESDNVVKFYFPAKTNGRKLFLMNNGQTKSVVDIEQIQLVDFSVLANQGDYVIISHEDLFNNGQGINYVDEYKIHRSADFTPTVIEVDQIIDQFGYGRLNNGLAIRRFFDYAFDNWFITPEYLFIIGQSIPHSKFRSAKPDFSSCLVPSYGYPASDGILTAEDTSYVPRIPVGRLAVIDPNDIKLYLDKVKQHESNIPNAAQNIDEKVWTKNIIHLGGGSNKAEQERFRGNLETYERILESDKFGGNVTTFLKTSSDPVQTAFSTQFDELIENGTSLITFFGHSSGTTLEFSIYTPENYNNNGKYPFMVSNGCYAGNIHTLDNTASKNYILLDQQGAIGFLSATSLSFDKYDHIYSEQFFKNIGKNKYGESIGASIVQTIRDIRSDSDPYLEFTSNLYTLHGDPYIFLNPHDKPDYVIDANTTWTTPANISVSEDTFLLNLQVTNIGMAVDDTFDVVVERTYPSGNIEVIYNQEHIATSFRDTFEIPVLTEPEVGLGYNVLKITVDPVSNQDQIPEMEDVANNVVSKGFLVLSDDIIPLHPYDNGIVNTQNVELVASIANVFTSEKGYLLQVDTNEQFTNPIASTNKMNLGGLLKWSPNINYEDGVTYYWRASLDPSYNSGEYSWHSSSFTFHSKWELGWNQSHLNQFEDDKLVNMTTNGHNDYKFVEDLKDIRVLTFNKNLVDDDVHLDGDRGYTINGVVTHRSKCFANVGGNVKSGVTIAVFDQESLLPKENTYTGSLNLYGGAYGSYHCDRKTYYGFDFFDSTYNDAVQTAIRRRNITNFINDVEDGDYILAYIFPRDVVTRTWPDSLYQAFESFGARHIRNLGDKMPYAVFGQKNTPAFTAFESFGTAVDDIVTLNAVVSGTWSEGYIESELIGPAEKWGELEWSAYSREVDPAEADSNILSLIGVSADGQEVMLMDNIQDSTVILSHINTRDYPWLKLRYQTIDDSLRSPSILDQWKVTYDSYPELALNAEAYCDCDVDTLYEGQKMELGIAIENVTKVPFDSLDVDVEIVNGSEGIVPFEYPRLDSLRGNEVMIANLSLPTINLPGDNQLGISVNTGQMQPEAFLFNNIGYLPFYVTPDNANPLLEVTFDGEHILDGDIVSGEAEILITLKDENIYLPLNDTALFDIFIEHPNGDIEQVNFDHPMLTFVPSAEGNKKNKASVLLEPSFKEDGIYTLRIAAEDVTGNASGRLDYSISFEVILASTITRVLNYPNPFTTSTKFVFTLTGTKVPDVFKIQIMTVGGTIVKEIDITDLGDIHVGRNITDYAWNGTDEFGDLLANGVYLYRVVTSIEGQDIERRATKADQYFKSDFGKMTIIR